MKNCKRLTVVAILLCSLSLFGCNSNSLEVFPNDEGREVAGSSETIKSDSQPVVVPIVEQADTVTITAVGDIMVHRPQYFAQKTGENTYDFTNNFKYVKSIIQASDLSIGNLETTILRDKPVSSYPTFNSPPEIIDAIEEAGFDVISTINNHTLDTGKKGVLSTLDELSARGLETIGTVRDKDDKKYYVETINNIKIGMTAFTFGYFVGDDVQLNGLPAYGIKDQLNVIDATSVSRALQQIKVQTDLMKEEGCEFIILMLHWGNEYQRTPNTYQKELAQKLIDEGVGLILGSHPHLVQAMEFVQSTDGTNEGLVAYSMGNFLSNQRNEILNIEGTENGLMTLVTLAKDQDEKVYIKTAEYIPTWISLYEKNSKPIYEIIPISKDFQATSVKYDAEEYSLSKSLNQAYAVIQDDRIQIHNEHD